jgi:hypothetical protein
MLAIAGVVAVVVRAFARRRDDATERFGRLATLLVVVQTSAFAGQEVLERLVSGAPLGDLLHGRILVTGMIVQVLVALVAAGVLWLLARTSSRLAAESLSHLGLTRERTVLAPPVTERRPHALLFATAGCIRAPPSS